MGEDVRLREVLLDDLPIFYEQQLDSEATRMAAFPSRERTAFDEHWKRNVLGNASAITRTVVVDDEVAGYVGSWIAGGVRLVGYWLGRDYWGCGVGTRAVGAFVSLVTERPLRAHVAKHNVASVRVLEKCGFRFDHAERVEGAHGVIEEVVLVLE